jgi:formamidopyrimidine-DNA glycosylase
MPELPEVETVKRIAEPLVVGRSIEEVHLNPAFPGVLVGPEGVNTAATLPGMRITALSRRGKYLVANLDPGWHLIMHLRMTGRLLVMDSAAETVRFQHLSLKLDNGTDLRFADQRKFGRVQLAVTDEVKALHARLGVEPLTLGFTPYRLAELLVDRRAPVKSLLLNQHIIAGLGNIYVDEALFRAGIHPMIPAGELNPTLLQALTEAIQHVLKAGIRNQGTTFSSFENPYGEAGNNASYLRVYGKQGEPCPRCGYELERIVVGGRGTTFCALCQPRAY